MSTKRKRGNGTGGNSSLAIKKQKLNQDRKKLPIWGRARDIRQALLQGNVLVLTGETGSGKSTQVPQFLLDSSWCSGKIAVTQPRRVAAITLARRVAEEMGSPLGKASPASAVGYSVRFDDNTSPGTKIKFLTEGMLLQEMLRDSSMAQYSCIVVDEVHERSVDVDLILGFLKGLLADRSRRKTPLKVVVMSATADVESLRNFFSTDLPGSQDEEGAVAATNNTDINEGDIVDENKKQQKVSLLHVEGRQYPVKLHYTDRPTEDVIDAALQRIFQIHCKEPMPGDVLVFLTGAEAINSLQKLVEELAQNLTTDFPKLLVMPLYAALSQSAQQRIFERAPPNTRKIILSTNIAETSVTVPGVRFVVDTGKAKVKQYRSGLGLESLLIKPISQSSADQRKGRAGREGPGQCFRLFTEPSYKDLEKDTKPGILQCDLSGAVLKMKARGIDAVWNFPFLSPPSAQAMRKALSQLVDLDLLDPKTGIINDLGLKVARLPLSPPLGRVILEAAKSERDCLLEIIDIVSCLESGDQIWLSAESEDVREKALEARTQLAKRQGDHLSLLAAVQAYESETSDRKRWAKDHYISHRAMKNVMAVRKQLLQQTKSLLANPTVRVTITEETQDNILKCFCVGFKSNIAVLLPDKSYKTRNSGKHTVAIHPSSFLMGKKVEAIVFNEFVFTQKPYARNVSAVRMAWLDELGI